MTNKLLVASLFLVLAGAGCQKAVPPAETMPAAVIPAAPSPTAEAAPVIPEGWVMYSDPGLGISFAHPPDVEVVMSDDKHTFTLLPKPVEDAPVPDMTITVVDGQVKFEKWEDFEVEYFDDLKATFRFVKDGGRVAGKRIENTAFKLAIDPSFDLESREDGYARIQNFVGQDAPNYPYPPESFFIEIHQGIDEPDWRSGYGLVSTVTLNGRPVLYGTGGKLGGETWPHNGYFIPGGVTVTLFSQTGAETDEGQLLAQDVISNIEWK